MGTTPSISRKRDGTSRTKPDAPLEPAPLDFACRASKKTNKFEPTFGLRGGMDEFRRLKAMYPNISSPELAEFQALPRRWRGIGKMGVAAGVAAETVVKTVVTTSGGEGIAFARTPKTPASVAPCPIFRGTQVGRNNDGSCSSSDFSRRDNRRRSHRRRREKNRHCSSESASPARAMAPRQPPASPLQRPQHLALPSVHHHPIPREPAS